MHPQPAEDPTPFHFCTGDYPIAMAGRLAMLVERQPSSFWVAVFSPFETPISGVYRRDTCEQAAALASSFMAQDCSCFVFSGHYLPASQPVLPGWGAPDPTNTPVIEFVRGERPMVEDLSTPEMLAAVAELALYEEESGVSEPGTIEEPEAPVDPVSPEAPEDVEVTISADIQVEPTVESAAVPEPPAAPQDDFMGLPEIDEEPA